MKTVKQLQLSGLLVLLTLPVSYTHLMPSAPTTNWQVTRPCVPLSRKNGTQGRVTCQFVVGADGMVRDVKVLRGVDPYLDKEAVRVIIDVYKRQLQEEQLTANAGSGFVQQYAAVVHNQHMVQYFVNVTHLMLSLIHIYE